MKKSFFPVLFVYCMVFSAALAVTVLGSRSVTVFQEQQPPIRHNRIVIDAGHGGLDGGATSCTGVLESGINLQIALRLEDLFHLLGHETVMIRKTDTSVYTQGQTIAAQKISDLKERVHMTNSTENAFLLSIHQNTFSQSRYFGSQVFCAADSRSRSFGEMLQQNLKSALCQKTDRKAKNAKGIYLMENIHCPGVLIECGFLSNPEEEARLRDPEYQKKLCCVIAGTLSSYFSLDQMLPD